MLKPRLSDFMGRTTPEQLEENWKGLVKDARSEEYWPTIAVKVQMTGSRPTRIWQNGTPANPGRKRVTVEEVDWSNARVQVLVESRSVWV